MVKLSPLLGTLGALVAMSGMVAFAAPGAPLGVEMGGEVQSHEHEWLTDYGNEGRLIYAPTGGHDPQAVRYPEPSVASMVFADRALANELVAEANANGERMCLADLGAQQPEFRAQRWWVFTC